MVKDISAINGIAKKSMLGVVLASSILLSASSPIKNTRQEREHTQTELTSIYSTEELKINSLQNVHDTIPTVHNKDLDETLLKLAETDDDRKMINDFLSNVYKEYGTYLASVVIQNVIDYNMFFYYLDGNSVMMKKLINSNLVGEIDTYKEAIENVRQSKSKIEPTIGPLPMFKQKTYDGLMKEMHELYKRKGVNDEKGYVRKQFQLYNDTTSIQRQSNHIAHNQHIYNWFYYFEKLISKYAGIEKSVKSGYEYVIPDEYTIFLYCHQMVEPRK